MLLGFDGMLDGLPERPRPARTDLIGSFEKIRADFFGRMGIGERVQAFEVEIGMHLDAPWSSTPSFSVVPAAG